MPYQTALLQNNLPATPSASWGTTLTAHATPHSKGTYATLMTTTYDVYGFWLGIAATNSSAAQTDMLLDIATGASQENVIVPELPIGWRASVGGGAVMYWFPIFIPRGVLVSGRIQALITVDNAQILMFANAGTSGQRREDFFSGCDAYGTVAASSQGTSHTPGNTGAESTAADIGTTMTKNYGAIFLSLGGTLTNTTTGDLSYHWEAMLGGVTLAEWYARTTSAEIQIGPFPPAPHYCSIPSGSQLQVRAECSGTAQAQDVAFHCFY